MRVPMSWLREYAQIPADVGVEALAAKLTALGLKLERLGFHGADVSGPLVVGRVSSMESEEHSNSKTIQWCRVDVGPEHNDAEGGRGIVCGAHNFAEGDLVVVSLPGTVLPGGVEIAARKSYGHISDGMICSAKELGLGDDHAGIIVLSPDEAKPGDDARPVLCLSDEVIEFEITPDRGYALSVRGVARETALALSTEWRDPADLDTPAVGGEAYPIVIDDPGGCPVFVARVVTGIDPSRPTPRWMSRRLQLAGMRPLSLVIDITNYVMLELGQPIHGYDRQALAGPIRVRRATPGEKLTTLDDVVRTLDPGDLLITDDSGPIGLAGVMGGEHTELSASTTDVVIEAAHFDPVTISRTARRHRLPSEASKRFERGVDPALPRYAAQRVADLLTELGGGVVEPGVTEVGMAPVLASIDIAGSLSADVVGLQIGADKAAEALRAVGCKVVEDGCRLQVTPPSWRPDLVDPYDLVEEVARIVGYDNLPSVLPQASSGRGLSRDQRLRRRIGLALAGAGYTEVKTYPFVGPAAWDALGLDAADTRRRTITIANPLSDQRPSLTTTLLPGMLETLARNVSRGLTDVALFELDPVFLPESYPRDAAILGVSGRPGADQIADLYAAVPDQPLHLATVIAGNREPAGWWGPARPATWADAIASVLEVGRVAAVELDRKAAPNAPWHPGRCAAILLDGVVIGHAGELHPRVCADLDLPARSAAAEIDLTAVLIAASETVQAPALSSHPLAKEDVALVVDADVTAVSVADALREGAGELCESVRLFDVYAGEQVPAGKKSLAFALRFRAPDRTLTEADTSQARDAAVMRAAEQTGAVQRS